MSFDPEQFSPPGAKIKVIGVGGGGGNAVNTMIKSNLEGVDFITCNTDVQSLRFSLASYKIQVGKELTRGLGAGADPDVGRDAALEDRHEIQEYLAGADMVFITAGMGGGTGTGGASVVAQIARELGALTVAVVTKPFQFEGKRRKKHAELGIARLRECVDTLITIPNQRLLQVAAPGLSMMDAFKMADDVLVNAVRGISDIINIPGTVNVDFADVKTVMSCMGQALMGIGRASGEGRAVEAARQAICSPLLEDIDIEGATGILVNITAGSDVTLMEVNEACSIIQEAAHEDANFIFGAVIDEALGDEIRVTVIATGFPVEASDDDTIEMLKQHQQTALQGYSAGRGNGPKPLTRPTPNNALTNQRKPEPTQPLAHAAAAPAAPHAPASHAAHVTQQPYPAQPQAPAPAQHMAPPAAAAPPRPTAPLPTVSPQGAPRQNEPRIDAAALGEALAAAPIPVPASALSLTGETEELARWTMDSIGSGSDSAPYNQDEEPVLEAIDSVSFESPSFDERLAGATLIDDPSDDFLQEETAIKPAEGQASSDGAREGASAPHQAQMPAAVFMRKEFSADDIDRKIDEALQLAERLKAPKPSQPAKETDDLDIPAFLRNGVKDRPLD